MRRTRTSAWRRSVVSRTLAAVFGGYALTSLITVAVTLLLGAIGTSRPQTLLAMTMVSFPVHATIVMGVFHAGSATRAWAWLVATSLPLALIVWLLLPGVRA